MNKIEQVYKERLEELQQQQEYYKHKRKRLGMARFITFLLAVILFFILLGISGIWATLSAILLLTIFLVVTLKDIKNLKILQFTAQLTAINEEEIAAISGDFNSFEEGSAFEDTDHPYTSDLDIFGKHSLFQLINRTTTTLSADRLAGWLKAPASRQEITKRQQTVRILAPEMKWRQKLQATGRHKNIHPADFQQILVWAESKLADGNIKRWSVIITCVLIMTALFIILAITGILPWKILWISFIVHAWIIWRAGKIITPHYQLLSRTISSLDAFGRRLSMIITKDLSDPYFESLQKECYDEKQPAGQSLQRLKKILERLELRYNPLVHFPLNLVFFWDWHQYRQLVRWHARAHEKLPRWMDAFSEIEALSSFANLYFNNPGWCFPEIVETYFTFNAEALGHPLIPAGKRVCNDVSLEGKGKMMLVTGSNMAGKSTFLRTVGVNVVLAMAGAPVCAAGMAVSEVKVISSMRIADNLEENISTFYAELKKLERIIEKSRRHEKCLLLLDEILRGTNSNDRHTGSRALIQQLLKEEAVGILATHDLALTDMAVTQQGRVMNYHFDVQVHREELFFDYKLKAGVCTSMNASLLMRKIGIDL